MKKQILTCVAAAITFLSFSPISLSEKSVRLPESEVKKFVSAIAAIKEYYIKPTNDNQLFNDAIKGMVASLDPHSTYLDKDELSELKTTVSGKFVGIGVELTTEGGALKVISPLEGTPADRAGIKSNDLIIKIEGQLVQNMTLREAVNLIKGEAGTKVTLTIIRTGEKKPLVLTITREVIKLVTVKKKMLENGFGYIRITFFQGPVDKTLIRSIEALKSEAKGRLKGMVLDLRNNPGGLLEVSAKVADAFLDKKKLQKYNDVIVYTKGRIPGSDIKLKAEANDTIPGVPLVVMINGGSASASEIVAGALQDYKRAVLIGTRSFGKGSVQTVIPISKEDAIKLTTALYYTPAGRVIQAQGILPDVVIPQLNVDEKDIKGLLDIDESNYRNHLENKKKIDINEFEAQKKLREKELMLAKDDYQLYEALMILKGMSAVRNHR